MYSISGAVNDALNYSTDSYTQTVPLQEDVSAPEAATILLQTLKAKSAPVLLMFDEIDYISPSSPTFPHWRSDFNIFFRALRRVYQECARSNVPFSIVICGVSSHWFTVDEIDGVENSALALVPETYLPPFDRTQSIEMIQSLGRSAGLMISYRSASRVAATCSDNPFWMRKAGSYLNSCYGLESRPIDLDFDSVSRLCDEFVEVEGGQLAYSSLRHLFRIYPDLGPASVRCIVQEDVKAVPQPVLSALGRYGILGDGSSASGPMVRTGVEHWHRDQLSTPAPLPFVGVSVDARSSVSAGSISETAEAEWSDLLGEVSRLRNKLERELRELVATTMRVKLAESKDGRRPSDVLVSALPAERREQFSKSNTREILKSMYWSDIVNVIRKNWRWFEAMFVDRKQMDLHAEIINERPDAHAKEIDAADLALQRRSILWFSERVSGS